MTVLLTAPESTDDRFRHVVILPRRGSTPSRAGLRPAPSRWARTLARDRRDEMEEPHPLAAWLLDRVGLDASHYRGAPMRRRVAACLRVMRARDGAEAQRRLANRPDLLSAAVNTMLIGVTSLFRDAGIFQALASSVLPRLIEQRAQLRVWSAGCSDGAELYSVAVLLDEKRRLDGADLLGTDCRSSAIIRAGAGVFLRESVDGASDWPVSAQTRQALFERVPGNGKCRLVGRVRERTRWMVHDLIADPAPAGTWDLVLCRNVTIYFKPAVAGRVWRKLCAALRPGGVLMVGKAERPDRGLPLRRIGPCLFERLPEELP